MTRISCNPCPRLRLISPLGKYCIAPFAFPMHLDSHIWEHPVVECFIAIFVFAVAVLSSQILPTNLQVFTATRLTRGGTPDRSIADCPIAVVTCLVDGTDTSVQDTVQWAIGIASATLMPWRKRFSRKEIMRGSNDPSKSSIPLPWAWRKYI